MRPRVTAGFDFPKSTLYIHIMLYQRRRRHLIIDHPKANLTPLCRCICLNSSGRDNSYEGEQRISMNEARHSLDQAIQGDGRVGMVALMGIPPDLIIKPQRPSVQAADTKDKWTYLLHSIIASILQLCTFTSDAGTVAARALKGRSTGPRFGERLEVGDTAAFVRAIFSVAPAHSC